MTIRLSDSTAHNGYNLIFLKNVSMCPIDPNVYVIEQRKLPRAFTISFLCYKSEMVLLSKVHPHNSRCLV